MSTDTHNMNNAGAGQSAPLRRFLQDRKQRDGHTTSTVITADAQCRESRLQQAFACRSYDSAERRSRRPQGTGSDTESFNNNTKPGRRRRHRSRTFKGLDSTRGSHHSLPRVDGYCRCGAKAEAPYYERCEDCFAEDSERWSGKDQSAAIHF